MSIDTKYRLRGTNFRISYDDEGEYLRMQPFAGYSFEVHAQAALRLSREMKMTVIWKHDAGDVTTEWGESVTTLKFEYVRRYSLGVARMYINEIPSGSLFKFTRGRHIATIWRKELSRRKRRGKVVTTISSIQMIKDGNGWRQGTRGIVRIDPKEVIVVVDPKPH